MKEVETHLDIRLVDINQVKPNEWNPNEQTDYIFEKEIKSIRKFGFIVPITVREKEENDFEIIDGEHRWRAMREMGAIKIPINNIGRRKDVDAKQLTIILNELKGKADKDKLKSLFQSIASSIDFDQLMDTMPFSDDEVKLMMQDLTIDWDNVDKNKPIVDSSKPSMIKIELNISGETKLFLIQTIDHVKNILDNKVGGKSTDDMIVKIMCHIITNISDDSILTISKEL